ncbi:MAG: DUF58 domain-containing protein [Frankiales bacterium]|nr:DUF58 domain-containing protein [Frankiales bacterium]
MALTSRAALLAAAGIIVVFVAPLGGVMVGLVAAAIAAAAVVDLALAGSPRAVVLERSGATSTRLGEPAQVQLVIRNGGCRRLRGWVRDGWPPSAAARPRAHPLNVAPGQRQRTTTTVVPTRRGPRRAGAVTLRCVGPLGIAARQRSRPADWSVQVLPPFASRRFLPEKLARLRELDGAVVAPMRGQGSEFDSLRDYVEGDDVRSIDWRATARRSQVVVRTWRPERDRKLLLVLDSGRTSAARVGNAPRFDAALDAALLLTALARHAGDRVGVLVHDRAVRARVDGVRGSATLEDLVRTLAPVEPALVETDMSAVVAEALRRLPKRSLVVLFTAIEPAAVNSGLLPSIGALLKRHVVVVASVADPAAAELQAGRGDIAAVYSAAAAEAAEAQRRTVTALLRRRGVVVTTALPDVFASHVADTYLELKAAGRL